MKIAVVGLGKIGSSLLAVLADSGYEVIGIDINKEIVNKINNGIAPNPETDLQKLLTKNKERITATTNYLEAIPQTDMAFIRVATPSQSNGSFSSEYVEIAVAEICRCIPDKKEYYNIINTSTVMPGTMEEIIKPLAERVSNRKIEKNLGLCYMPDWVALGSVIENLTNPDMVLIGESDEKAGDELEKIIDEIIKYGVPIHRMNFYNSEIAKIANNNFISMKISFANTIAEYCEKIPKGDASQVLEAIGNDSRIGQKFMKPGLGYAGFCFVRDQKAFIHTAKAKGIMPILAQATDKVNNNVDKRISVKLRRILEQEKTNNISILGITYKPDTIYTKESTTLKIIDNLSNNAELTINVYDPAMEKETLELPPMWGNVKYTDSTIECLENSKIIFIGTPWKQFKEIPVEKFRNKIVIDSFGILKEKLENQQYIKYMQIGTDKFQWEPNI